MMAEVGLWGVVLVYVGDGGCVFKIGSGKSVGIVGGSVDFLMFVCVVPILRA